ncbi:hypothetical protein V1511DRAFT_496070 [Dipodascopsis uninucleata]
MADREKRISEVCNLLNPFSEPDETKSRASGSSVLETSTTSKSPTAKYVPSPSKRFRRRQVEKKKLLSFSERVRIHSDTYRSSKSDKSITGSPLYAPWSRVKLLERLSTFPDSLTEESVSPLLWARFGWYVNEQGRVKCDFCGAELDIEKLSNEIVDVKERHDEKCAWRKHGCNDALYNLSISLDFNGARELFLSRIKVLSSSNIINNIKTKDTPIYPKSLCSTILSSLSLDPSTESNIRSFELGLVGFDLASKDGKEMVRCSECFIEFDQTVKEIECINGHRSYCPWVRSNGSQGWNLILATLEIQNTNQLDADEGSDDAYEHKDQKLEALRENNIKNRVEKLKKLYIYRPKARSSETTGY